MDTKEVVTVTTAIQETSAPVALAFDQDVPWTRESVIQAFIDDGVNQHRATGFVDSMHANIRRLIDAGEKVWFPSERWLRRFHRSLVLGIPDALREQTFVRWVEALGRAGQLTRCREVAQQYRHLFPGARSAAAEQQCAP